MMANRLTSSAAVRRSLSAISVLFAGTMVTALLTFITQLLLARLLPIVDFGRIVALLATINFLTPIGTAGIGWFLLQVYGHELLGAARWLRPATAIVAISTGFGCTSLAIYVLFSDVSAFGRTFSVMTAVPILLGQVAVELVSSRFQLENRYNALTWWQATTQTGRFLVVGLAALVSVRSGIAVLAGYGLIGLLATVGGIALLRALWTGNLALTLEPVASRTEATEPNLRETISEAAPFALTTVFYILYFQGSVVILDWLSGGAAAATFNVAFVIVAAIFLVPNVIYMKYLVPKLYRWGKHDRGRFEAAFHVGVPVMTALGVIFWIAIAWGAHPLIALLFGGKYAAASLILIILSASIPVRFAQATYSSVFITKEEMKSKVIYLGLAAIAGCMLNFALIPVMGIAGAAIATVAAEVVLLALQVHGTARYIKDIDIGSTFRPSTFFAALRHLAT
jgi:O-antigen/teichoic acid export membrane protein